MITSNLSGGLGNYMFQISAAFSLALDNKDEIVYDLNDYVFIRHTYITNYFDNIFRKIKFVNDKLPITNQYNEPNFHYTPIEYKPNTKLNGYYQSEKYFKHNQKKILELFSIDSKTEEYLHEKYGTSLFLNNTCSLHVRRGDYLILSNHHPVCDISYYKEAVEKIGLDKIYLIFSDDINWCKTNLDFIPKKIFIEGNSDYQDLYLMSNCDDNVIANSSFSWWGAWLNQNQNKQVIAPKKWFGVSNLHLNTSDLYCDNWIQL